MLTFLFFAAFYLRVGLYSPYWMSGGFLVTNLACAFAVWIAAVNPEHKLLTNKFALWIGKRSCGLYAYHFPIFFATERFHVASSIRNAIVLTSARFVLSAVVAMASYDYIEKPILALKSKFKAKSGLDSAIVTVKPEHEGKG